MGKDSVVLEVVNLWTEFDTQDGVVHAVNGVSYALREGETLGIVGESGCGKSVSVLSIMRLLPEPPAKINAQSITFENLDLLKLHKNEMTQIRGRKIAMVFQDPMTSLNPVLTIGLQLREPLQAHLGLNKREAEKRAGELLQMVGIPEPLARMSDYPHQFSGGMRQRVMIAMCLACNPAVLIADEPTTALDVTIQSQIVELVKNLRDQLGMSLIWITHDLGIIAGLADRVIVMYAGYVIEEALVDELYENPSHPYTVGLLRSLPRMDSSGDEKLESIVGVPPDLLNLPAGCPFAPRCTHVQEICLQQNPILIEVAKAHQVACWLDLNTGRLR